MDHDVLLSMFWPEAIDEHGVYNGPIEGFVEWLRSTHQADESWMHHNTTQTIEIDGDQAWTETYCLAMNRIPPRDGSPAVDRTVRVRYCDRLERRDGEWRIAHRRVVYSPSAIDDHVHDWEFSPNHLRETRDRTDPAYWG
jgi:SnoaL-like domain